ncbi:hypothetical protein [Geminicoccus roseus]|uniref:hypothetical protein n=1 Tax=Geminicoccus roseus TaxID=404900 RepID=UPI0003F8CCA2|nr:hypothetical protein [Geminicoccus roseus]
MQRAYSVSQIQFDCLSYIKEFGARPDEWLAGACADPHALLQERFAVERAHHALWLTRPALTPRAAAAVVARLHGRYAVRLAGLRPGDEHGRHVFLVRPDH